MSQRYLISKARNSVTGQCVKNQDLTGARYRLDQRFIAQELADQLAVKMSARTSQPWYGFVEEYTPTVRKV
jgi:hypothetical protein